VTGGITLMRQVNGQPVIAFPLPGGGMGYCTRSDSRWWQAWPTVVFNPRAPVIGRSTVFASGYSGLEILGTDSGTLTYAWRGNSLDRFRWHGPGPVLVGGQSLTGVRGVPGFLDYPTYTPAPVPQFLALVPEHNGGIGLYERVEPGPFDWGKRRFGLIASQLGLIDSVTAVMTGNGGLVAIMRAGSRLYETSHSRGNLPADFGTGWSRPTRLRTPDGTVPADGNPDLINSSDAPGRTHLALTVPVSNGVMLLTPAASTGLWEAQRLPIHQHPASVTLLNGEVKGRPNMEVAYRIGHSLFNLWKWDNGTWHQPVLLRWGSPP
jgi:hypothetical protein